MGQKLELYYFMLFSLLKNAPINATKKAMEKVSNALLSPPKKATIAPTKKTEVAVKKRPMLKQNPVAVARITVGNNWGI